MEVFECGLFVINMLLSGATNISSASSILRELLRECAVFYSSTHSDVPKAVCVHWEGHLKSTCEQCSQLIRCKRSSVENSWQKQYTVDTRTHTRTHTHTILYSKKGYYVAGVLYLHQSPVLLLSPWTPGCQCPPAFRHMSHLSASCGRWIMVPLGCDSY